MNKIKSFFNTVTSKTQAVDLSSNLIFIICHDTSKGEGHRYFVCDPSKVKPELRGYAGVKIVFEECYCRDIDYSLDRKERKQLMNKPIKIILHPSFIEERTGVSKTFKAEVHIYPESIDYLPEWEKKDDSVKAKVESMKFESEKLSYTKQIERARSLTFKLEKEKLLELKPKESREDKDKTTTGQVLT